jgi:tetratricopeptide (TPR) repeat protein
MTKRFRWPRNRRLPLKAAARGSARIDLAAQIKSIAQTILAILFIVLFVGVLWDVLRETLTFEPFEVSEVLQKRGYTSKRVTTRLMDELRAFIASSNTEGVTSRNHYGSKHSAIGTAEVGDIEIPDTHITLKSVATALKEVLGVSSTVVGGDLSQAGDTVHLRIRVERDPTLLPRVFDFYAPADGVETLFRTSAMSIVGTLESGLVATYRYNHALTEEERQQAVGQMQAALDENTDDSRSEWVHKQAARIVRVEPSAADQMRLVSSRMSIDSRDYEYGAQQLTTAIEKNRRFIDAFIALAYLKADRRDFDEALHILAQAARADHPIYKPWGGSPHEGQIETARAYVYRVRGMSRGDLSDLDEAIRRADAASLSSADALVLRGDLALERDDFDGALSYYSEIPDDWAIRSQRLSDDAYRRGEYVAARELASKAIQVDPAWTDGHLSAAYALISLNRLPEALEQAKLAGILSNGSPWSLLAVGAAAQERHDYQDAIQAYRTAIDRDSLVPDPYAALGSALYESDLSVDRDGNPMPELERTLGEAIRLGPRMAWPKVELAALLIDHSRLAEARALIVNALATHPGSAEARKVLGDLELAQGEFDSAIDNYRAATKLSVNPRWADGRVALAYLYLELGQLYDAREAIEPVMRDSNHICWPTTAWADVMAASGRMPEALSAYKRVAAFHPLFAFVYHHWANSLRDYGKASYAEIEAKYRLALLLDPESADVRTDFGTLLDRGHRYADAIDEFDRVLRRHPGNSWAYALRGLANQHAGHGAAAVADFDSARRANPDFVARVKGNAEGYERIGAKELARELWEVFDGLMKRRSS